MQRGKTAVTRSIPTLGPLFGMLSLQIKDTHIVTLVKKSQPENLSD